MNDLFLNIIERCVKLRKYLGFYQDNTMFYFTYRNKHDAELSIDFANEKYIMTYWYEDLYDRNFYHAHSKELSELESIEIMQLAEKHLKDKAIEKVKKDMVLEILAKERCELEIKLDAALSRTT